MSTKRQLVSPSTTPPPWGRSLPVDILLEVAARADAQTLVRVAATSKPLRRGILHGADFRRRLLAVRAAATAATDRLFDPSLLRGVAYASATVHVDQAPPGLRVGIIDPDLLDEHGAPWSSRDGFLVLKCPSPDDVEPPKVCVCDALTGHVTCLPPMTLNPRRGHYAPALLAVDHHGGAGRAFELLVATQDLEFQTFSSKTGQWGAVRAASSQPAPPFPWQHRAHPAVVGCTLHWLIIVDRTFEMRILALDVDKGTATMMQLPEGYTVCRARRDVVPVAVGGRLGVVVMESLEVSMWTWTASPPTSRWSRQLAIRTQEMQWQTEPDVDGFRAFLLVGGFGERSGAVVLQLKNGDLVRLDLGTKEVTLLSKGRQDIRHVCLHETDLASMLQTMTSTFEHHLSMLKEVPRKAREDRME